MKRIIKVKDFFCSAGNNIGFSVKTSFLASKKYFSLKCIILLSTTLIPIFTIWLWKGILNGIINIETEKQRVILLLAAYLLLLLFGYILNKVNIHIQKRYNDEINFYFDSVMINKTSRMDLAFFDSSSMADKISYARNSFWAMEETTWTVFNIISEVINVIITFILICNFNVWIGFITILLIIPFSFNYKKYLDSLLKEEKKQVLDKRKIEYYGSVFFDNIMQFEMRLNNIAEYFIYNFKKLNNKLLKINTKFDIKHNVRATVVSIFSVFSEFLILIVSVFDVLNKRIGIGDLQYNVSMVTRFREQASSLVVDINRFIIHNTRLNELKEFINIKPEIEKSGTLLPSQNPKIEFCNVSFRYPNCEKYVLKDCSFTIELNEKIGLIGLNGAGKSTIIKLMFRFYDPEEGCIKLDGVDLKKYDIYAVRNIFGVLFQDCVKYCLPLREIIALSDFGERFNDVKLKKACDMSGASEIVKDWDQGFDTVLGRNYADNGKDLSGGQWQLIGLARAYFKDSEYMILDEPSASLDPITEDRIFEQLYHLSEKKSCITISHRLSNTVIADKILVIGDGKIIEQGTHFELLKQNGEYARLFNLQAERYID